MRADLALVGFGNVARRFSRLIEERRDWLSLDYDLDCRVVGIWNRGGETLEEGTFSLVLPRNLGPGESVQINAMISAPPRRAAYGLDLALVQRLENGRGIFGGARQRVAVDVE